MKRILLLGLLIAACDVIGPDNLGKGELRVSFAQDAVTRGISEIPDTGEFILTITDSKGGEVYSGRYAACPEVLEVPSGNYTVRVLSHEFVKPAFSSPQFGDEQCVTVPSGGVADVRLVCNQVNSGVRLKISPDFLTKYPDGVLFLKSSEGKLMYSYSEKRIAYFNPGPVSLILNRSSGDELLMTRELEAQEILVLGVAVSSSASAQGYGIGVAVDTTRNWTDEHLVIGENKGGGSYNDALSVSQARSMAPKTDVWVSGYIVGGDLTSSSGTFEEPFKYKTNLILGPRSSTKDRSVCIAVQIPAGTLRDRLNLVDNPSLLGQKICLHGDLVTDYFNMVGLKNLDEAK